MQEIATTGSTAVRRISGVLRANGCSSGITTRAPAVIVTRRAQGGSHEIRQNRIPQHRRNRR